MRFQIRHRQLGAHVHCRVFQRQPPSETWQKNGDLVFDEPAWSFLRVVLPLTGAFELQPEDHDVGAVLLPDCDCRNPVCGHKASTHRGPDGACVVPGCACGPGGWA